MRVQYVENLSVEILKPGDNAVVITAGSSDSSKHGWVRHVRGVSSNRDVYSVAVVHTEIGRSGIDEDQVFMYAYDIPNGAPVPLPAPVRMVGYTFCLLYTSPSPRDRTRSRMPSSA